MERSILNATACKYQRADYTNARRKNNCLKQEERDSVPWRLLERCNGTVAQLDLESGQTDLSVPWFIVHNGYFDY